MKFETDMMEHWVLLSSRVTKNNTRKQTDREQKAWGLIRTATGIVAKLISQKEIGLHSISVSSREANLPANPQGEQPWYWLPDFDMHDS